MKFGEMEVSNSTSFNWTTLDDQSKSEESTQEVYIEVKAGTLLKLYQVVGECGGRTIRTSSFESEIYSPQVETNINAN